MDKYTNANMVFSKFSRIYMDYKKDLPIRPSEMGVLNIIIKREGLFTPIMLADLLEVSKVMVTNHISVLEKNGYVKKEYLENDKRSFYVIPTKKAKQLVCEFDSKLNQKLKEVEELIGKEAFTNLISTLDQVRKYFGE